jgi:chemotaxis protein histidine kinase CheA
MAANRTLTTLSIALIVFVMLTFVLAVTTYLFFKQKFDAENAATAAAEKAKQVQTDFDTLTKDFGRLRELIGTDMDDVATIEAEQNQLFEGRYSNYDGAQKSYLGLVRWLDQGLKAREKLMDDQAADSEKHRADAERSLSQANEAKTKAEQARDEAEAAQKKEAEDFASRRAEHEKSMEGVVGEQKKALAQSEQTKAIIEELRKLGPLLSPEARRRYETPPADSSEAEPWPERVRIVLKELTDRQKAIRDLNGLLSSLRVADGMQVAPGVRPGDSLQKAVADSLPLDDRIEGFDGRVVDVDERDRSVILSFSSTEGMRPGLLLAVFDPAEPRPPVGSQKGMVQVSEVQSDTLARGVIREDDIERTILPGDGVATNLWRPGESTEIVIVGYVDLGGGLKQSRAALKSLVERAGATAVETVGPRTAAVVDAGPPPAAAGSATAWKASDEGQRKKALEAAKGFGVRVIGVDAIYDMLGLDREAAGRLGAAAVAY